MDVKPRLHAAFPALQATVPHIALGTSPTPLRPLRELAASGAQVWLKDEGPYGDGGWGGNKVRKLEWLLAEVKRRGRGTILTVGGLGTNWGLATALYGREHGINTALALVDQPVDDHVRAQLQRLRASGATLHFTHTKARTIAALPYLIARHRRPYLLPSGGSSAIGAIGYIEVAYELAEQVRSGVMPEPACVVTALGSGGTAAGLFAGLELAGLTSTTVVAVVVTDLLRLDHRVLTSLARRAARVLRDRGAELPEVHLRPERLTVVRDWLGPGYGHATPDSERAIELVRSAEGLELDPVYTAKAMAALLALARDGRMGGGPVVFLNTNGPR
jgi:D-cysteine desulfhydrase